MNVFDFDNTILKGDSTFLFCAWALRRKECRRLLPGELANLFAYLAGKKDFISFKSGLFAFMRVLPDDAVERFWDKNIGRIKSFYFSIMREDDVIITASPQFLVAEAVRRLGPMRVIGTDMDRHTGEIRGLNCKREEKINRFHAVYPGAVPDAFYSDSMSDEPMARISRTAFMVKGEMVGLWPTVKKP